MATTVEVKAVLSSSNNSGLDVTTGEPTRLFGVRLAEVMKRPSQSIIPTFIKHLIHFLTTQAITTDGLFRIAPNPKILQEMKLKVDQGESLIPYPLNVTLLINKISIGEQLSFTDNSKDLPHVGAALLKMYLRELPEPVLSYSLYHQFVSATSNLCFFSSP